ncbi:hypothetical protein MTR_1g051855 [Medicago truncatula]|uniref:Uncharacterized protein n=1 Tax=Medicago truncatula TaxID=3880 RepID=A0A072VJB1_MEDTR|nr:hypothetical protein MTR_1g051855 [Medicago truncatula]
MTLHLLQYTRSVTISIRTLLIRHLSRAERQSLGLYFPQRETPPRKHCWRSGRGYMTIPSCMGKSKEQKAMMSYESPQKIYQQGQQLTITVPKLMSTMIINLNLS